MGDWILTFGISMSISSENLHSVFIVLFLNLGFYALLPLVFISKLF